MKKYKKLSFIDAVKQYSPKPTIEISEKQIKMLRGYSQVLLSIIAVAGVIGLAAVIPGALIAFKLFYRFRKIKVNDPRDRNFRVTKTFYYLKRQGFINIIKKKNDFEICLTEGGLKEYQKLKFRTLSIPKVNPWDGKFWQVAADIPTKHRKSADAFRKKTKMLGLFSLQRTLWFYPHDLRKEIELISQIYGIAAFVTVMKIDLLDPADEKVIKKHFKENAVI